MTAEQVDDVLTKAAQTFGAEIDLGETGKIVDSAAQRARVLEDLNAAVAR